MARTAKALRAQLVRAWETNKRLREEIGHDLRPEPASLSLPLPTDERKKKTATKKKATPAPRPVAIRPNPTILRVLNTGDAVMLGSLPGVGRGLAEKIVADRAANGEFASLEDAARVKGLTLKKVAAWSGGGPATPAPASPAAPPAPRAATPAPAPSPAPRSTTAGERPDFLNRALAISREIGTTPPFFGQVLIADAYDLFVERYPDNPPTLDEFKNRLVRAAQTREVDLGSLDLPEYADRTQRMRSEARLNRETMHLIINDWNAKPPQLDIDRAPPSAPRRSAPAPRVSTPPAPAPAPAPAPRKSKPAPSPPPAPAPPPPAPARRSSAAGQSDDDFIKRALAIAREIGSSPPFTGQVLIADAYDLFVERYPNAPTLDEFKSRLGRASERRELTLASLDLPEYVDKARRMLSEARVNRETMHLINLDQAAAPEDGFTLAKSRTPEERTAALAKDVDGIATTPVGRELIRESLAAGGSVPHKIIAQELAYHLHKLNLLRYGTIGRDSVSENEHRLRPRVQAFADARRMGWQRAHYLVVSDLVRAAQFLGLEQIGVEGQDLTFSGRLHDSMSPGQFPGDDARVLVPGFRDFDGTLRRKAVIGPPPESGPATGRQGTDLPPPSTPAPRRQWRDGDVRPWGDGFRRRVRNENQRPVWVRATREEYDEFRARPGPPEPLRTPEPRIPAAELAPRRTAIASTVGALDLPLGRAEQLLDWADAFVAQGAAVEAGGRRMATGLQELRRDILAPIEAVHGSDVARRAETMLLDAGLKALASPAEQFLGKPTVNVATGLVRDFAMGVDLGGSGAAAALVEQAVMSALTPYAGESSQSVARVVGETLRPRGDPRRAGLLAVRSFAERLREHLGDGATNALLGMIDAIGQGRARAFATATLESTVDAALSKAIAKRLPKVVTALAPGLEDQIAKGLREAVVNTGKRLGVDKAIERGFRRAEKATVEAAQRTAQRADEVFRRQGRAILNLTQAQVERVSRLFDEVRTQYRGRLAEIKPQSSGAPLTTRMRLHIAAAQEAVGALRTRMGEALDAGEARIGQKAVENTLSELRPVDPGGDLRVRMLARLSARRGLKLWTTSLDKYGIDTATVLQREIVAGVRDGRTEDQIAKRLAGPKGVLNAQKGRARLVTRMELMTAYNASVEDAAKSLGPDYVKVIEAVIDGRNHPFSRAVHRQVAEIGEPFKVSDTAVRAQAAVMRRGAGGIVWAKQDGLWVGMHPPSHFNDRDIMRIVPRNRRTGGSSPAGVPPAPLTPMQRIRSIERRIKTLPEEHVGIHLPGKGETIELDPSHTRAMATRYGLKADAANQFILSPTMAKRIRRDGNAILTHNHPDGLVLSESDIQVALRLNLAQLRAVAPDGGVWSVKRPAGGWRAAEMEVALGVARTDAHYEASRRMDMILRAGGKYDEQTWQALYAREFHTQASRALAPFGVRLQHRAASGKRSADPGQHAAGVRTPAIRALGRRVRGSPRTRGRVKSPAKARARTCKCAGGGTPVTGRQGTEERALAAENRQLRRQVERLEARLAALKNDG